MARPSLARRKLQAVKSGGNPRAEVRAARIAVLPELVRNQIAAGEVVERPSSVVKELLENALDAMSRHCQIELEQGGARCVRVVDDGVGMVEEDLRLAFAPHATSKLREVSDLDHIASLGFRGEALASIGSVARCRLFSRVRDAESGFAVENEGGAIGPVTASGGPPGTAVEVRDLFFNTPARRRFLKRTPTELARCLDVIQRSAIASAGIGFSVAHDGRAVFQIEPGLDLLGRIRRIFGSELAGELVPVLARERDMEIDGYLAPPRLARADLSRQMWFLNGRSVRDRVLARVLKEGYRGFLDHSRQPVAFLCFAIDPAQVDVNVHPTKAEVRFREPDRVFGFLVQALREALARADVATPGRALLAGLERRGEWKPASELKPALQPELPGRRSPPASGEMENEETLRVHEIPSRGAEGELTSAPARERTLLLDAKEDLRGPFLQVDRTYWIRALEGGFEIIDQHALHERVTYEDLRRELRAGSVMVQRCLVPPTVELSRAQVLLLADNLEDLERIGVALSIFGPTTVAVQGYPARWRQFDAENLVRDALGALERSGSAPTAEELLEELLHRSACRASVMAGDVLDEQEVRALLERASRLESDQTCPHGRPTRVRFTRADLERAFHRR